MYWNLLLAHFLGDYPLQSDWMVRNRSRLWVRLLHGTIHYGLMALLTFPVSMRVLPVLLLVSVTHMGIDISKGWLSARHPDKISWLYMIDQGLHFVVLGFVSAWMAPFAAGQSLAVPRLAAVYAIGFLFVTYIWLISERILFSGRPGAGDLEARAWPRAWVRGGLLLLILTGWNALSPAAFGTVLLGMVIQPPYPANRTGTRALLIDVLVTLAVAALVIWGKR